MARKRSRAKVYGKSAVKISFDFDLHETMEELEDGIKESLRPAAHQASLVLYNEMRARVPVKNGVLQNAIYRKHLESQSDDEYQAYAVGPNKSKAQHWYLIEYGHFQPRGAVLIDGKWVTTKQKLKDPKWIPPKPYIRPTWDAKSQEALDAAKNRLAELVGDVMEEMGND